MTSYDYPPHMVPVRRPIPAHLKSCPEAAERYRWTSAVSYQHTTLAEKEAFADKMLRRGARE
jgi:hypothetical protein